MASWDWYRPPTHELLVTLLASPGTSTCGVALLSWRVQPAELELFEVAQALDTRGLGLGFCQGWRQHAGKNSDDGNHYQ